MTLNKPRIRRLRPYIFHLMEDPHKGQVSLTQVRCLPSGCSLPFKFIHSWLFNVAKRSTQLSRFKSIKIISLTLNNTQLFFPKVMHFRISQGFAKYPNI